MMQVMEIGGEEARNRWRDMMDHAFKGGEVIVKRYDKPQAVLVSYEQWQMLKRHYLAYLDKLSAEADAGNYFTMEQVEQGLRERGLID
jgi:hypothetical protein